MFTSTGKTAPPQAFMSSYAPRLRSHGNSLISPIVPPSNTLPAPRVTKRGTAVLSYAEDAYDDDDLRIATADPLNADHSAQIAALGEELTAPIDLQGIWRDWMGRPKRTLTEKQVLTQSVLPWTLIPIRIDMDIQAFRPDAPLPTPSNAREFGINENLPAYKTARRHPCIQTQGLVSVEPTRGLTTPDQFAKQFLEEYAGVALHPLFHSANSPAVQGTGANLRYLHLPATNGASTPMTNGASQAEGAQTPAGIPNGISAKATALPSENFTTRMTRFAEMFAKTTCADLGLSGEWVNAMTHSIYEAVLRAQKGGVVKTADWWVTEKIDNDAVEPTIGAGWRYDQEHLCDEWEPKVEILSPEEIEKREGDRERQIRRLRRETARFSSTSNMTGTPANEFFNNIEGQENMGRGERSKKKRRFRSLSPVGRGTPGAGGGSGYGGQDGGLQEGERQTWRCSHCWVWGTAVWAVRDGPKGPRSLCNNCGYLYERDKKLPPWSENLFYHERPTHEIPQYRPQR
ncbi:hypothetical protein J3E74DRAFT_470375 [Bipolaris maydis]|nr:hypothetical protein J3E74DRAFT_470375 [Bipolaris maydis]